MHTRLPIFFILIAAAVVVFDAVGCRRDRQIDEDSTKPVPVARQLSSAIDIYPREGAPGNPHDHSRELAVFRGGADATDSLEVSSAALGPNLPHGIMIAMNSKPQNFLVFRWQDVASAVKPGLRVNGVTMR